ncbi:hypothetical protein, partial [Bacteroides cellulosilyticus]|uniref:hypothetical protein n=1 Tax=Bacteroides cellulosilyticus TaxID=246787 RepID=UPI0032EAAC01
DWAKVPAGERILGTLDITSDRGEKEIQVLTINNDNYVFTKNNRCRYTLFAYSECEILDSKNAGSETGSS